MPDTVNRVTSPHTGRRGRPRSGPVVLITEGARANYAHMAAVAPTDGARRYWTRLARGTR